ncbi:hypothetical protein [Lentzea sp. E54]|uniref:hypothetical protein n=1 Tax=Lentzea xerophila TaxID=3435883 RepID=UPI003DA62E78
MTGKQVRLGTFDAESRWRPADLANLPSIGRAGTDHTVAGMDELLAGFCAPGDLLVTRWPMNDVLRSGLAEAGITFDHVWTGGGADGTVESQVARDSTVLDALRGFVGLAPYAVLPDTVALAERLGLTGLPDLGVVAEVNSKTWSNDLVHRLELPGAARRVDSVDGLVAAVSDLDGPAVVKDPYGVSGRGTVEIGTPGVLAAVERFLRRQVAGGRRVELLVQEKFLVLHDFSAHLEIHRDGTWVWLGVQAMTNRGFRHLGSGPAWPGLVDEESYRAMLAPVADAVGATGYSGPACVDSAVLADGRIVPVLEVNARHSLGLLTRRLDERGTLPGLRCHLVQLELVVPPGAGVADLVAALGSARCQHGGAGVTVLSGSALAAPGGRVYAAVFCAPAELPVWRDRLHAAVAAAGMSLRGAARAA